MKISVAMAALNLSGMRVVGFGSFPITGQTGWRRNAELLGQVGDHHTRDCSRLREERSQKTDCAQLNGIAQAIVVTPPDCDLPPLPVVQVKVSSYIAERELGLHYSGHSGALARR